MFRLADSDDSVGCVVLDEEAKKEKEKCVMCNKRFASLILACFVSVSFYLPAVLAQDIEVSDLESRSVVGEYVVGEEGLQVGSVYLIDRDYDIAEMSEELEGATYIMTAMDDEASTGEDFITFTVEVPVVVWIATDKRQGDPPAWLSEDEGWTLRGDGTEDGDLILLSVEDDTNYFVLRSKEFSAGEISLGGNADPPANIAPMYVVLLTPGSGGTSAVEPSSKLSTTWGELKGN